jgi:cytochrome c oxidase assembly factor CtaG
MIAGSCLLVINSFMFWWDIIYKMNSYHFSVKVNSKLTFVAEDYAQYLLYFNWTAIQRKISCYFEKKRNDH